MLSVSKLQIPIHHASDHYNTDTPISHSKLLLIKPILQSHEFQGSLIRLYIWLSRVNKQMDPMHCLHSLNPRTHMATCSFVLRSDATHSISISSCSLLQISALTWNTQHGAHLANTRTASHDPPHLLQQSIVKTFHQVSMLHVTSQELGLLNQLLSPLSVGLPTGNRKTHGSNSIADQLTECQEGKYWRLGIRGHGSVISGRADQFRLLVIFVLPISSFLGLQSEQKNFMQDGFWVSDKLSEERHQLCHGTFPLTPSVVPLHLSSTWHKNWRQKKVKNSSKSIYKGLIWIGATHWPLFLPSLLSSSIILLPGVSRRIIM